VASVFSDTHELIQFARRFLTERTDSLEADARVCTVGAAAPFPAILYTFATIDLLGALLGGDAKSTKGMTKRTKVYMRRFMHYSDDHCTLLMNLFRHKIVHLAQPSTVIEFQGTSTAWGCWHDDATHHLKFAPLAPARAVSVTSGIQIEAKQRFEISIRHFVEDISTSVHSPGGYLHQLSTDADLQDNFTKAIEGVYHQ